MGPLKAGEEVNFMVRMGKRDCTGRATFPKPRSLIITSPSNADRALQFPKHFEIHSLVYVNLTTTVKMGCFIPEKQNSKLRIKRIKWSCKIIELKVRWGQPLKPVFQLKL